MSEAEALADPAIDWVRDRYDQFRFFVERDVVWTLQLRLRDLVHESGSDLRVFNDFPMIRGARRSLSADLALVSTDGAVQLALELNYEPSHRRTDILSSKFPVVFWGRDGVAKDVERVRLFVAEGRAVAARSYFIDEGGYFAHRPPHPGSSWASWGGDRWALVSRAP